jgi:hypothetical protein
MTHRMLLAVVLAPEVWDLTLVVRRCTGCVLLLMRWSCVRSPSWEAYCCNHWIVVTVNTITALPLALAHTGSL